jgi:hypothetical protein
MHLLPMLTAAHRGLQSRPSAFLIFCAVLGAPSWLCLHSPLLSSRLAQKAIRERRMDAAQILDRLAFQERLPVVAIRAAEADRASALPIFLHAIEQYLSAAGDSSEPRARQVRSCRRKLPLGGRFRFPQAGSLREVHRHPCRVRPHRCFDHIAILRETSDGDPADPY